MEALRPGHAVVETAIGPVGIAWSARGLTRLQLPGLDTEDTERRLTTARNGRAGPELARDARIAADRLPAGLGGIGALLAGFGAGEPVDFGAVPVDFLGVGAFRLSIYRAARAIRHGETVTYGELAARAGHAGAARETGQAMGSNPVPLVVPCHRVLAAGRAIGGFSAPGGAATKARLLALEGVRLGPPASGQACFAF